MKVEIIILNYNGGDLLLECLPSIVESTHMSQHQASVTILDNVSTDGSEEKSIQQFPEIKLYRSPENKVLCSYNNYLAKTDCDIAILLNNDIKVDPNFIDSLIEPFISETSTFMVTPKCLSFDGTQYEGGVTKSRMRYGIFWASSRFKGYETHISKIKSNKWLLAMVLLIARNS